MAQDWTSVKCPSAGLRGTGTPRDLVPESVFADSSARNLIQSQRVEEATRAVAAVPFDRRGISPDLIGRGPSLR